MSSQERFIPDPTLRTGYDQSFLGCSVPVPGVADEVELLEYQSSTTIDYTRFSLSLNKEGKFAQWVAWNVDGATLLNPKTIGRAVFRTDRRLASGSQWTKSLYHLNRLDQGHIARRADLIWGDKTVAHQANYDSFYYSNVVPHMDDFNRRSLQGLWGRLENDFMAQILAERKRFSELAGPVFQKSDPDYDDALVPTDHWKILVWVEDDRLRAAGFVLRQVVQPERVDLSNWEMYQKSLSGIGMACQITFPGVLIDGDIVETARSQGVEEIQENTPLTKFEDIRWG